MIKEFVLKFVAALAGVEHSLSYSNEVHEVENVDPVSAIGLAKVPYSVVTVQMASVSARRTSALEVAVLPDRSSHPCY